MNKTSILQTSKDLSFRNWKGLISMDIIDVTPEMAQEYLKRNTKNRPISAKTVDKYAFAMVNGEWMLNGETIIFDWNGDLLNGQHRLHAIIKSDDSQEMIVVKGVNPEAFSTLDGVKPRTGADALAIAGFKHYTTLNAASKLIFQIKAGKRRDSGYTQTEILEFVQSNTRIIEFAEEASACHKIGDKMFTKSWLCAFLYVLSEINDQEAQYFVEDISTGANLPSDDPVYLIRRKIMSFQGSRHTRIDRTSKANYIIYAWNLRREGRTVQKLYVPNDKFLKPI